MLIKNHKKEILSFGFKPFKKGLFLKAIFPILYGFKFIKIHSGEIKPVFFPFYIWNNFDEVNFSSIIDEPVISIDSIDETFFLNYSTNTICFKYEEHNLEIPMNGDIKLNDFFSIPDFNRNSPPSTNYINNNKSYIKAKYLENKILLANYFERKDVISISLKEIEESNFDIENFKLWDKNYDA